MKFAIALSFILGGCVAVTELETPLGTYRSTRDSDLQNLRISIVKGPDGTETTEVEVGSAGGLASPVYEAQANLWNAVINAAFEAGKAAALVAGVP